MCYKYIVHILFLFFSQEKKYPGIFWRDYHPLPQLMPYPLPNLTCRKHFVFLNMIIYYVKLVFLFNFKFYVIFKNLIFFSSFFFFFDFKHVMYIWLNKKSFCFCFIVCKYLWNKIFNFKIKKIQVWYALVLHLALQNAYANVFVCSEKYHKKKIMLPKTLEF